MEEIISKGVGKGGKTNTGFFFTFPKHKRIPRELWGVKLPIVEAVYDMSIPLHKRHYKNATQNDPVDCTISHGFTDRYDMDMAYIGSGRHAYTHMRGAKEVVHSVVRVRAAKIRDGYDTKKAPVLGEVSLHKPPLTETLESAQTRQVKFQAKKKAEKKAQPKPEAVEYQETKVQTKPPTTTEKKSKKDRRTRQVVLGIPHRPRAPVSSKAA